MCYLRFLFLGLSYANVRLADVRGTEKEMFHIGKIEIIQINIEYFLKLIFFFQDVNNLVCSFITVQCDILSLFHTFKFFLEFEFIKYTKINKVTLINELPLTKVWWSTQKLEISNVPAHTILVFEV